MLKRWKISNSKVGSWRTVSPKFQIAAGGDVTKSVLAKSFQGHHMDLEHSVATEAWNFRYYSITTAKIFEYYFSFLAVLLVSKSSVSESDHRISTCQCCWIGSTFCWTLVSVIILHTCNNITNIILKWPRHILWTFFHCSGWFESDSRIL